MMSALHRSNADGLRPYFGAEVALRFLSPTHQAAGLQFADAGPVLYARYLRQPHKNALIQWDEYRLDGDLIEIENARAEAYQQLAVRGPDYDWTSVRWLLVNDGSGWLVDAVFVAEPDQESDQEYLASSQLEPVYLLSAEETRALFATLDADGSGDISLKELEQAAERLGIGMDSEALARMVERFDLDASGGIDIDEFQKLLTYANDAWWTGQAQRDEAGNFAAILTSTTTAESPSQVVETVMRALRQNDEPYKNHGAAVATRYCSPTNRASSLSPEQFGKYLEEPWYRLLLEWDEIQLGDEDDEDDEDEGVEDEELGNSVSEEVLVRREGTSSWSIVSFELSRHNGRWLIDSINITE